MLYYCHKLIYAKINFILSIRTEKNINNVSKLADRLYFEIHILFS